MDAVSLEYNVPDWNTGWVLINTVENTGSYEWMVPPIQFRDCLLRISDADDETVKSVTDAFTIVPAALELGQPIGGEKLLADSEYEIQWDTKGDVYFVLIEYRAVGSGDDSWQTIGILPNTGSYNWMVPIMDCNDCYVRISDVDRPQISSTSSAFEIFTGKIYLGRPNGGEELLAEKDYYIRWETVGDIDTVWLEYGIVEGLITRWHTIEVVENTGLYRWTVPNVTSSKCLVRVSNADKPSIHALSSSFFTMLGFDCAMSLPADLSGDCRVDLKDLAMFVQDWLVCGRQPESFCWD